MDAIDTIDAFGSMDIDLDFESSPSVNSLSASVNAPDASASPANSDNASPTPANAHIDANAGADVSTNASTNANGNADANANANANANPAAGADVPSNDGPPAPQLPPPKPRPHRCLTCERTFARLEHLKRHERSHTKEKPFECAQCKRCFARRDLLLRHQQKLHQSTTPPARPRIRRESAADALASRGQRSSMSGANGSAPATGPPNGVGGPAINGTNGPNGMAARPNGLHVNGHAQNGYSGVNSMDTTAGPNGLGNNGLGSNGFGNNGIGTNGFGANGLGAQGLENNGLPTDGFGVGRLDANGLAASGLGNNGLPTGGFGVNGLGASGLGTNAMYGLHGTNGLRVGGGFMRPRANTISHVGTVGPNLMNPAGAPRNQGMPPLLHSRHPSLDNLFLEQIPLQSPPFVSQSAIGNTGMSHGLPRLSTNTGNNADFAGGMLPTPTPDYVFHSSGFGDASGSTINPNALHFSETPLTLAADASLAFSNRVVSAHGILPMHSTTDSFNWLSNHADESAIDTSSPSAQSANSPGNISDVMLDGSVLQNNSHQIAFNRPPPPSTSYNGPATINATTMTPMTTGTAAPTTGTTPFTVSPWQLGNQITTQQTTVNNGFSLDLSTTSLSDLLASLPMSPDAPSPSPGTAPVSAPLPGDSTNSSSLPPSSGFNLDVYFSSTPPPSHSSFSPILASALNQTGFPLLTNDINDIHDMDGTSGAVAPSTPASMNGSNSGGGGATTTTTSSWRRQRTSNSNSLLSTITDATRTAIVTALSSAGSPSSMFSVRRFSLNSPTSPTSGDPSAGDQVPSTSELQRFIGAYIRDFHPHFPFLHLATMSFEIVTPAFHGANRHRTGGCSAVPSNGCLLLCMAAIGALYEGEHGRSRGLFNMAKRMIQLYLDERNRKSSARMRVQQPPQDDAADTPLWLVQAMLLTVIYGHNSSDKRTGEIASTHCAALSSLAHGAELLRPMRVEPLSDDADVFSDELGLPSSWALDGAASASTKAAKEEERWLQWKVMEERKRTLYSVFVLMSLLMMSYNHIPTLTNSEIMLDLPCDEEFYAAPTCAAFMALGGVSAAYHNRMKFHQVLGGLLRSSEKQARRNAGGTSGKSAAEPKAAKASEEPAPSTFGCFILINALHNYIWETRQRHHNKTWTNEETDKMHRHIEPALQAWQRAWARNAARHAAEQPYQHGLSRCALATDALPMLDLAYVRLFVNLAPSKEKFWQRNWDGLADELCHGSDIVQHAEHSPVSYANATDASSADLSADTLSLSVDDVSPTSPMASSPHDGATATLSGMAQAPDEPARSSRAALRREKHLRKAAFFAVDALSSLSKLGLPPTDMSHWRMALQPALSSLDCAQVLAEWVATLQDRVGPYLGILGHDDVELGQVPAIMLLEDDDVKLLDKIHVVLQRTEQILMTELGDNAPSSNNARVQLGEQIGYAAKILSMTAYILGKAAVWPVTRLMAECLTNHASHMRVRAEKSILGRVH